MRIKIIDHNKNTVNIIDYPGTVLQFVKIHFAWLGFYQVEKTARDTYEIYDEFETKLNYTISKAKKGDI